jgi:L,D-peptidoglycan transpeptidase YkuD (ErfK/YbiS/YcfS/YnhG family)
LDLAVSYNDAGWQARFGERLWLCAIGRGGVRRDKAEGDGATPAGCWPIRRVLYRADRLERPATAFPCDPVQPHDGWCDAPGDPQYNRLVQLPYQGRHERLWRDEEVYDCIVVLGYNDAPVRADAGSAVFLHVARTDLAPTEGCVALLRGDLLEFLSAAPRSSRVCVAMP